MFNESQQRHLLNRLRGIDERLSEALARLEPGDADRAFRTVIPDASPAQRKILADYLAQVRFASRRFALAQQLSDEHKPPGGLKAFRTAVLFAEIAAEELRPKYWRGYGEVNAESAAAAERFAELVALLRRLEIYVARGEGGGIAARLARLSGSREEIALLRELERIIAAHGLTELRAPLEALVERAASPRFEIAVLGRVSAGKSSLLNWWLGEAWLPTGVTPVTTVPTHIAHGDVARAMIERAGERPLEIPVTEIAAHVSEQRNPGNVERIVSVFIEAPSERLREGVRLVDTPGLGSVAAGAARTLEYLPHCDLGILLIEAGAPIAPDDLDVARALLDGGSDILVVLSKADRLSGAELEQSLAYARATFESQLSIKLDVRPVSTVGAEAALAEEWFERALAPRLASHAEWAAEALKRKIAVLRESVEALLEIRLGESRSGAMGPDGIGTDAMDSVPATDPGRSEPASLHEEFAQARADFERVRSELLDFKLGLARFAGTLLELAARELARCWMDGLREESRILARIEEVIARRADEMGHAVARRLETLREEIVRLVEHAGAAPEAVREFALPRGRPIFDTAAVLAVRPRCAPPPRLLRWGRIARPLARLRVRRTMPAPLAVQLGLCGEALYRWSLAYIDELARGFDAAIAIAESAARAGADQVMTGSAARSARRDLERLQQWPADAA